ncbi:MAG: hypothetical protein BWY83_03259 [bacterium ADurb.Bin478]|nr:MAG: hypothetical protein BWY83_03259 [bacterium ADurb.Bin478]
MVSALSSVRTVIKVSFTLPGGFPTRASQMDTVLPAPTDVPLPSRVHSTESPLTTGARNPPSSSVASADMTAMAEERSKPAALGNTRRIFPSAGSPLPIVESVKVNLCKAGVLLA